MNDSRSRRIGWGTAFFAFAILFVSAVMLYLAPHHSSLNWLENQVKAIVTLGVRWFVFGGFVLVIFNFLPVFFFENTRINGVIDLLLNVIGFSAVFPLYLAVGIAILRYRLFDIDVIIRRTLTYSLITGFLALVYFGSVLLLQEIFQVITGRHQSPIATVISTLVIAALFNPLRRRVQGFIDRRFYRRKYDAERTMQEFAAGLRNEVDLDVLSSQVEATVSKTMQPKKVLLWLRTSPSVAAPSFFVPDGIEEAGEGRPEP